MLDIILFRLYYDFSWYPDVTVASADNIEVNFSNNSESQVTIDRPLER